MKRTDRDKEQSRRVITRRALGLGALQLAVTGTLLWRLRDMQLEQSDAFRLLAEENRINLRLLPPTRGPIHDRNGVLLAGNEQNYRVVMTRDDAGDIDLVLARLQRLIGATGRDGRPGAREDMLRNRPFVPVTVAERLTWEEISRVAANAPALPGVTPEMGLSRAYPLMADMAHVVGYVGPVSDRDLARQEKPRPGADDPALSDRQKRGRARAGSASARQGRVATCRGELGRSGHARVGPDRGENRAKHIHLTI